MRKNLHISKNCITFAPKLKKQTNQRWRQHHKNGNKVMTAQIEVSVKVYLYQQIENKANDPYCNEAINFCEVYPTWEEAERALKVGENKEATDGVPYETALGRIFQYHIEFDNNAGDHVWEIRHERFNKEGRLGYEVRRVIEKKF